jgi:hypothetical protein
MTSPGSEIDSPEGESSCRIGIGFGIGLAAEWGISASKSGRPFRNIKESVIAIAFDRRDLLI